MRQFSVPESHHKAHVSVHTCVYICTYDGTPTFQESTSQVKILGARSEASSKLRIQKYLEPRPAPGVCVILCARARVCVRHMHTHTHTAKPRYRATVCHQNLWRYKPTDDSKWNSVELKISVHKLSLAALYRPKVERGGGIGVWLQIIIYIHDHTYNVYILSSKVHE